jgi:acetolactate synthase-1/2/3 large subunit
MTGADVLVRTLLACGVDVCFTNPGTSEMHMVAALDRHPGMRAVLALFEGVVTGAADGYARLSGRPAATLLHLGPGLANGLANLHNARKAGSPVVNIVGEHAIRHLRYDAPLKSDIEGFARPVSHWVGRAEGPAMLGTIARDAVRVARTKRIATLVLPADVSWSAATPGVVPELGESDAPPRPARPGAVGAAYEALTRDPSSAMLLLGGTALLDDGAYWAGAIARGTGCRVATQSLSGRMTRGGDRPDLPRIPFDVDAALGFLKGVRTLVLIGAPLPVAFFAYPDKPSVLIEDACITIDLTRDGEDPLATLHALGAAAEVKTLRLDPASPPAEPAGPLSPETLASAIAATLPSDAIVVDESITAGRFIYAATGRVARHDWLNNMGGAIGYAMPVAIGAAIARPDRRVLAMVGDGSAFYTEQALWTMAREKLDITVLILANREYAVLRHEWRRVGATAAVQHVPGSTGITGRAHDMLSLDRPTPDWVALARGHGVAAERVDTASALTAALRDAYERKGPRLIEAWL